MKRIILLVIACNFLNQSNLFAQDDDEGSVTNVLKVSLLSPGISYEARIGQFHTIHSQIFGNIGAIYGETNSEGYSTPEFFIDPALSLAYRYYYNYDRRTKRGKRTAMNSMNYISVVGQMIYTKVSLQDDASMKDLNKRHPLTQVGAVWGFQRNYRKRFSLDINVGLGCYWEKNTYTQPYSIPGDVPYITKNFGVTLLNQVSIGFWLGRSKEEDD